MEGFPLINSFWAPTPTSCRRPPGICIMLDLIFRCLLQGYSNRTKGLARNHIFRIHDLEGTGSALCHRTSGTLGGIRCSAGNSTPSTDCGENEPLPLRCIRRHCTQEYRVELIPLLRRGRIVRGCNYSPLVPGKVVLCGVHLHL